MHYCTLHYFNYAPYAVASNPIWGFFLEQFTCDILLFLYLQQHTVPCCYLFNYLPVPGLYFPCGPDWLPPSRECYPPPPPPLRERGRGEPIRTKRLSNSSTDLHIHVLHCPQVTSPPPIPTLLEGILVKTTMCVPYRTVQHILYCTVLTNPR
jgi:hypothetical protein